MKINMPIVNKERAFHIENTGGLFTELTCKVCYMICGSLINTMGTREMQWGIKGKVCIDCYEELKEQHSQMETGVTLEEYIETVVLANKLSR